MELLWYLGAAWIAYVYVGYPVLVALWGFLRALRPQSRDDYLPTVSVLIAARNEARDIEWKLRQTLQWHYPPERLEVLVASDASDDGTDEIVQQFS
ncbi:MAG TPA: glycosyltransferase, partial [Chthonomonadales bacterium]|nr:glycosyltransferase [Chthonomonadales bacterium]